MHLAHPLIHLSQNIATSTAPMNSAASTILPSEQISLTVKQRMTQPMPWAMGIISGSAVGIFPPPLMEEGVGNICLISARPFPRWTKELRGLSDGVWGVCANSSASNSQNCLPELAAWGATDDCTMFTVGELTYDALEATTEFAWEVTSELSSADLYDGGIFAPRPRRWLVICWILPSMLWSFFFS